MSLDLIPKLNLHILISTDKGPPSIILSDEQSSDRLLTQRREDAKIRNHD